MIVEHELAAALNRKQPPRGLVERVMARIDSRGAPAEAPSFFRQAHGTPLRLGIALVLLVMMIGVGVVRQREVRREQQQAEFATRQLMIALQIASEALNDAKRIVKP
jgi:hypothetical protein